MLQINTGRRMNDLQIVSNRKSEEMGDELKEHEYNNCTI